MFSCLITSLSYISKDRLFLYLFYSLTRIQDLLLLMLGNHFHFYLNLLITKIIWLLFFLDLTFFSNHPFYFLSFFCSSSSFYLFYNFFHWIALKNLSLIYLFVSFDYSSYDLISRKNFLIQILNENSILISIYFSYFFYVYDSSLISFSYINCDPNMNNYILLFSLNFILRKLIIHLFLKFFPQIFTYMLQMHKITISSS